MNTEKTSNRKEWVKNAAIVFLSVMLVLTFFSNTIMNYSLPEVATAQIAPGSITAKIRGTGNLVSEESYVISIQESRKIASVAVKQGDVVEKDQVLFGLEDVESAELEEAQKTLNEMLLSYSNQILKGEISPESFDRIQSGKVASNAEYQARIQAAKDKVELTSYIVEEFEKQVKLTQNADVAVLDTNADLEKAKKVLEELDVKKQEAQGAKEAKEGELAKYESAETSLEEYNGKLDAASRDVAGKRAAFVEAKDVFYDAIDENAGESYEENAKNADYLQKLLKKAREIDDEENAASQQEDSNSQPDDNGSDTTVTEPKTNAVDKFYALQNAYEAYRQAVNSKNTAQNDITQANADEDKKNQLKKELAQLEKAYEKAKSEYDAQKTVVDQLTTLLGDTDVNKEKHLANLNKELINANLVKAEAEEELAQLLTDISNELALGNQNRMIKEQREKVDRLKEDSVGTVITAPMAGTVTAVNKIAGEQIVPGEELLVMQPEGKGFSLSFPVTVEQSKKVTIGEQAEIQNAWYYSDIKATLSAIRPDPDSKGTKKLLVFDIQGDVQVGQSISLSIGQKSVNYDLVVPNSALREDNNGKFILIVESKNSPLGNRYTAARVDVEVLGTDDTKSGIKAPLYGYEFVITTATQPVEAGQQIRLAEN